MDTSASATDVTRNDTHRLQRAGFVAFGLITAAYIIVFARFTMFPFQDFPNHLTRATVLADLLFHHGAMFGPMFEFRFIPEPYLLGDLMLAGLVEIFGPTAAGALWNTVVLLSGPLRFSF